MVTTTKAQVLQTMQQKNISFFKVSDVTGKNFSYIQDDEEVTPEEAYNELSDYLGNLEPGIVTIHLSEKSYKEKANGGAIKSGNYVMKVRIGANNLQTPQIGGLNADYKNLLQQNFELQNKIMLLEHQKISDEKHRLLEEKIEGLKNTDVLEKYAPLIQMAISQFMPGSAQAAPVPVGIAGTDEEAPTTKTRLTKSVNRLLKIDNNFVENLEMLADFAEAKPEQYKKFIPMLKMM